MGSFAEVPVRPVRTLGSGIKHPQTTNVQIAPAVVCHPDDLTTSIHLMESTLVHLCRCHLGGGTHGVIARDAISHEALDQGGGVIVVEVIACVQVFSLVVGQEFRYVGLI